MTKAPTRPVLRYHGGKWRLAPWIISHFPPHRVYVEPFGGAASVLLQKPRVAAECYNDLDGQIVNVFRILRDPDTAEELRRRIALTPFARDEFYWSYDEASDNIDAAHKTIVRSFFGHGSDGATRRCRTGFRGKLTDARSLPAQAWATWWQSIEDFTDRLSGVLIEQRDAFEVIERLDGKDALHFVDPPYVSSTRSSISDGRGKTHGYRFEMTDADHRRLARLLKSVKGAVVLAGYPSDLYGRLYSKWFRFETIAMADGAKPRQECLWLNQAAVDRGAIRQPSMFAEAL